MTSQSGNQVSTSLGNSGLCWTVFARNRDTAVPADGNGDLQTLICVLVARPRRCLTLSNPVPWQNWMAAYLGYTLRMKTLFRGWPVMVYDTHTRRRKAHQLSKSEETSTVEHAYHFWKCAQNYQNRPCLSKLQFAKVHTFFWDTVWFQLLCCQLSCLTL